MRAAAAAALTTATSNDEHHLLIVMMIITNKKIGLNAWDKERAREKVSRKKDKTVFLSIPAVIIY